MKTAGFDILLLLNEKLLNEVSGVLFYNNFLTFNGKKDFASGDDALPADTLSKIPATLKSFLEVRYRCKLLHEPHIDFRVGNKLGIKANLRIYIWMMDGLELKFDASLNIETPIYIDGFNQTINVQISQADVKQFEIKYGYTPTQDIVLQLDDLFENALKAYFEDSRNPLQIELPTIEQYMPSTDKADATNKIPIFINALKMVNNTTMVVAANFFDNDRGNEAQITNFAKNCNLGIAISETAMLKLYDFWWTRTTWEKKFQKEDSFTIDMVDKIVGFIVELIGFVKKAGAALLTAGIWDIDTEYLTTTFNYTIDLRFRTKPTFDLLSGNRVAIYNLGVKIYGTLNAIVEYKVTHSIDTSGAIPDECTPWEDDIKVSEEIKKRQILDLVISIRNLLLTYCVGKVVLNEEKKCLEVEILDFDVDMTKLIPADCLYWDIPSSLRDRIKNSIKGKILDAIPPIVLSPTFEFNIPGIDWPVSIEGKKLTITNHEAIVGAFVHFKDLQNELAPVPKYIGNTNNMEVHRAGCDSILDTYETHQIGFYTLQTALKKNFDGCQKCLPTFHQR